MTTSSAIPSRTSRACPRRADDEESLAAPPTKEQLAERNKRFSRPRKPMGPAPKDEPPRRSDEEHGTRRRPPTPAPEPPEATEAGGGSPSTDR